MIERENLKSKLGFILPSARLLLQDMLKVL